MMKKITTVLLCIIQIGLIAAQDTLKTKSPFSYNLNSDIVSRYVWRGLLFSPNVNIQPSAGISFKGLSLSTWASYGLSDQYAEIDFTLSYNIKNLTISFNDYYTEIESNMSKNDHYNFKRDSTPHALEAMIAYKLAEKFPLTLTMATYFYGNDRNSKGENYYSTYLELSYPFVFSEFNFNLFAGGTPFDGLYAKKAAVVNVGFSSSKTIKISPTFSFPLSASIVSNPSSQDIYLITKITF